MVEELATGQEEVLPMLIIQICNAVAALSQHFFMLLQETQITMVSVQLPVHVEEIGTFVRVTKRIQEGMTMEFQWA